MIIRLDSTRAPRLLLGWHRHLLHFRVGRRRRVRQVLHRGLGQVMGGRQDGEGGGGDRGESGE